MFLLHKKRKKKKEKEKLKKARRKKPITRGDRDRAPGEVTFNEDTAMPEAVVGKVQEEFDKVIPEPEEDSIQYETLAIPEVRIGKKHREKK